MHPCCFEHLFRKQHLRIRCESCTTSDCSCQSFLINSLLWTTSQDKWENILRTSENMFSPWVVRELQVLSCHCTAISCDSWVKGQGTDTAFSLAEKGDKSSKVSFQRGAILINRSLSHVLLERAWSRWAVNSEQCGLFKFLIKGKEACGSDWSEREIESDLLKHNTYQKILPLESWQTL